MKLPLSLIALPLLCACAYDHTHRSYYPDGNLMYKEEIQFSIPPRVVEEEKMLLTREYETIEWIHRDKRAESGWVAGLFGLIIGLLIPLNEILLPERT